jgi:hypothetical protein
MSVYSVSNKYLDAYDPFWTCRLLSLKVGVATILLFICNAFLLAPQSPMFYILTTVLATLASEAIPAPNRLRKFANFSLILFLLATSTMIFGMFSYFRFGLFFVVMAFSYLVLRFMAANPKVAAVPTIMIMWGIVNLNGGSTDFNAVANNYLYYFEFGMMGAITVLLFPDFTPRVFDSAFLRILGSDVENIGNTHYRNSHPGVLSALSVIHSKLPFLPERYTMLYEAIINFQNAFMKPHALSPGDVILAKSTLSELMLAVNDQRPYSLEADNAQRLRASNPHAYSILADLVSGYNLCKA